MTIKIDHINTDRSEDPGYWYLWALGFNNTFRLLLTTFRTLIQGKSYNINTDPPLPSLIVMWQLYAHTIELYMKTYLLAKNHLSLAELRSKKYGHNLEELRKKSAELEPRIDDKCITQITQNLRKFTKIDWGYMKYPPKRTPLGRKHKLSETQHIPGMYGEKTIIPPLDLLVDIVKPLVYTKD